MKPTLTVSLEIKSLSEREFEGHGSIFKNVDLGGDIVLPGAFKRTLAEHRKAGSLPQMFWMHDPSRVPGKWLDMHEDKKGLAVRGVLAETDLGNEIHTLLKMDAVRGLSIGYITRDQDFDKDGHRLIKEADLWEVSVVSLPMNPKAEVTHVKSRLSALGEYVPTTDEMRAMKRDLERWLRDHGLSRALSVKYASSAFADVSATLASDVDSSETLESSQSDSGETEVERAVKALEEMFVAATLKAKLGL